ncbi:MAG: hypothetical protein LBL13_09895 [Bacteroidales bacterium]|jgi:hypothetical protein|nr:hypothetical protein [Bacteroidales bacterium]
MKTKDFFSKYKLIIGIVIPVCLILVFMFFLAQDSNIGKAINELNQCENKEQVKSTFDKYKEVLTIINDKNEREIDKNFLKFVREKLASFNLSEDEINTCKSWLPPAPTSLNLIIVPDLSRRIIDSVNNPDQIINDTIILNHIWNVFEKHTRLKKNSRDRLIVDVTDEEQATGRFRTLANNLIFDLSEHKKEQTNRLYFTDSIRNRYTESIKQLYGLAKRNPLGADYFKYFKDKLLRHIQKSTLFDNYKNVLIIITDGYLESEENLYTGGYNRRNNVARAIQQGRPIAEALNGLRIPNTNQNFPTLEVLILEITERRPGSIEEPYDDGTSEDYDILKALWSDWFRRMQIRNDNDFFIRRNDATKLTKEAINGFLDIVN